MAQAQFAQAASPSEIPLPDARRSISTALRLGGQRLARRNLASNMRTAQVSCSFQRVESYFDARMGIYPPIGARCVGFHPQRNGLACGCAPPTRPMLRAPLKGLVS